MKTRSVSLRWLSDLTDAPLLRRVSVPGLLLRDAGEKCECFLDLRGHAGEAVLALYLVDVGEVIGSGVSGGWAGVHGYQPNAVMGCRG